MALPSLHSELVCLNNLQETLQGRLVLERAYTSSLTAWRADLHKITPHLTSGLREVFLSLVDAAENNLQPRQDMETRFESQIQEVIAATEKLQGYFERIAARSEQLEEFDDLAREALEERELRYKDWKAWIPKPVPPAATRGWLRPKPRNPLTSTERTIFNAYNLADMQVRRCLSTAEVARCSFKDKVIAEVDVITITFQVAIDAIAKCLRLFAEDQQACASNASAGASRIVKAACDTFGFRVAGLFQETLASEGQNISTASIPYNDLESISRYPTIESQPIVVGFSLPPYYFSYTASTKFVVNVFCQLVSFVHDNQTWGQYAARPTPVDYSLAPTFRELERSWTGDETLNREFLCSLGTSTCADLVKALLASFPEPLINYSEGPAGNMNVWNSDIGRPLNTTRASSSDPDSAIVWVPVVPPLYGRPQGEMLQALCVSLIPVFREESRISRNPFCDVFSDLLTRGKWIKNKFPMLVRRLSTTVTTSDKRNAPLQQVLDPTALPTPFHPPAGSVYVTQISPTSTPPPVPSSAPRLAPSPLPAVCDGPQSITQAISTAIEVEPKPDEFLSGSPINNSTSPSHTAANSGYGLPINDINSLKNGIVKTAKNKANAPYTILLVGESGVGKSSLLKFIANALLGNDIDHYDRDILDRPPNGPGAVGRTASPHLYEITSVSGILVRILDTPGLALASTQDKIHKENIVACIKQHVDSVSAVLILANGRVPITNANMDRMFAALSALLPKTLVNNIAFMFIHVWGPLFWDVPQDMVPEALKNGPTFLLDNPMHRVFLDTIAREACEQRALGMLVKLFDWVDSLEPQPATEIIYLYEQYQHIEAKTINILGQRAREVRMRAEIDELMITLKEHSTAMDAFSGEEKGIIEWGPEWQPTITRKPDMQVLWYEGTKRRWDEAKDGKEMATTLIAVDEMILHELNQVINCAMGDLVQLVERYNPLSLAGSCLAQVRSAVSHLEAMAKQEISRDRLEKVKESLDHMKRKLELLNEVEEHAKKGVSGYKVKV